MYMYIHVHIHIHTYIHTYMLCHVKLHVYIIYVCTCVHEGTCSYRRLLTFFTLAEKIQPTTQHTTTPTRTHHS